MSRTIDPYSRVYWRAVDDDRFIGIWDDDAALATWVRLLVNADMAWPATANLYQGCKTTALKKLVSAGLVDPKPGQRYRIHGLDTERQKRSDVARDSVLTRYARSTPVADTDVRPYYAPSTRKEEKRKEEKSIENARDGLPNIDERTQQLGERLIGSPILTAGQKQLTELDRLLERHGPEKTHQAMEAVAGVEHGKTGLPPTWTQLIYGTRNRLEPLPSAADSRVSEKADREAAERAAFDRTVAQTKARNAELLRP